MLEMRVDLPELLRGRHLAQRLGGLLVVGILGRWWAVPDHP